MNTEKYYRKILSEFGECCAVCKYVKPDCVSRGWRSGEKKYLCDRTYTPSYTFLTDHKSCYQSKKYMYYERDYQDIYNKIIEERKYFRYFILTVIFDILGLSFENEIYQEIKTLIELVREDDSTQNEANLYNNYGPEIANNLVFDEDRVKICHFLLENYIVKIYNLISSNNQEEAINVYKEMAYFLFLRYRNKDYYESNCKKLVK